MEPIWAVITFGVIGLFFLVLYLASYGRKPYLGYVGLAFWLMAGNAALPKGLVWSKWSKIGLAVLAGVLLALAAISAIRETRRRLEQFREASEARAEMFLETLKAEQSKQEKAPEGESTTEGEA